MRSSDEGYDWLDDPFNDKKAAKEAEGKGAGAWVGLGCGCLVAVAFIVFAAVTVFGALAEFNA